MSRQTDSSRLRRLANDIVRRNQAAGRTVVGAVVGATRGDLTREDIAAFGDAILLSPGIGAQGATYADIRAWPNARNIMPTSTREVLGAGPGKDAFQAALARNVEDAAQLWR